jgi:hypothetical protein
LNHQETYFPIWIDLPLAIYQVCDVKDNDWQTNWANLIRLRAEVQTLRIAIEKICVKNRMELKAGMSVRDWYRQTVFQELDKLMISLENADPELTTALQIKFDKIRNKKARRPVKHPRSKLRGIFRS